MPLQIEAGIERKRACIEITQKYNSSNCHYIRQKFPVNAGDPLCTWHLQFANILSLHTGDKDTQIPCYIMRYNPKCRTVLPSLRRQSRRWRNCPHPPLSPATPNWLSAAPAGSNILTAAPATPALSAAGSRTFVQNWWVTSNVLSGTPAPEHVQGSWGQQQVPGHLLKHIGH